MSPSLALALALLAAPASQAPARAAPRLVVLDVATEERGIKPSALAALSDLVTLEASRYEEGKAGPQLDVLSGREIRDALKLEGEKQSIGCDKSACAGEIAQAFGARYVAFLVLVRLGANYTLNLSLFDSDAASVVGRAAAQATTVPGLAPALPAAVRALVAGVVSVDAVRPAPIALAPARDTPSARGAVPGSGERGAAQWPALADDEIPLELAPLTPDDASICSYDAPADRWHCGGRVTDDGVPVVVVEREKTGGAATHGVARFTPRIVQGCLEGVDVELVSADESVVVDWRDAVFVVNGEAVPARPVRTIDRPMNAPPGATARETIVGATQRCVGGRHLAGRDHDAVSLTLGFMVGATPARAKWLRTRALASVDERSLLELLPVPELLPPPPDLVPEDAAAPAAWATVGGAVVGALAGVVGGSFVATAWMPKSASLQDRALAGAGYGAVCLFCCGTPSIGAGLLADTATTATFEQRQLASERWRAEKKRVAAFVRARGGEP